VVDRMRTSGILVEWNNGKALEVPVVSAAKSPKPVTKKKVDHVNEVDLQENEVNEETGIEIGTETEVNVDEIGTETETEIAVTTVTKIGRTNRIGIVRIAVIGIAKIVIEIVERIVLKEIVAAMMIVSRDRVTKNGWRDWKKVKSRKKGRSRGNHGNPGKSPVLQKLVSEKKEKIAVARIVNVRIEGTARTDGIAMIRVIGSDGNVDVEIVIVTVAAAVIGIEIVNVVVIEIEGIGIAMMGIGMVKEIEIATEDEIAMKENCLMMSTMA